MRNPERYCTLKISGSSEILTHVAVVTCYQLALAECDVLEERIFRSEPGPYVLKNREGHNVC